MTKAALPVFGPGGGRCWMFTDRKSFGLYVGDGRACLALVKGGRRAHRILAFHEEFIGRGPEAGANLGKLLARAGALGRGLHAALDGRVATARLVSLPLTNARQIQKTARFQAENLTGAVPIERLAVDHHIMRRRPDGSDVMLFAIDKERVDAAATLVREAGASLASATLDCAALFNLAAAGRGTPDGRCALVDKAGDSVRIMLSSGGEMTLVRSITAQNGQAASRIADEIRRSQVMSGDADGLECVVLTGPDAASLHQGIADRLGCRVEVLDPLSGLDQFRNSPPPAEGLYAVGAALKGLGAAGMDVDFRRAMDQGADSRSTLRKRLAYTGAALCVLFLILAVKSWREADVEEARLAGVVAREKELWDGAAKGLGIKREFRQQYWDKVLESSVKKAGRSGEPKALQYSSFLETWRLVALALDGAGATVANIAFDQEKTVIGGQIADIERFDDLAKAFRARFGDAVQEKFERKARGQQKSTFTIEISNK